MIRPIKFAALAAAAAALSACATSVPTDPAGADRARAPVRPGPGRAAAPPPVRYPGAADVETAAARGVVQYAQASSTHRTLAAALIQAQLTEALSAPGPFTLFAPTDTAFNAVPVSARSGWLQEAGRSQLQSVLRRHVVPGRFTAAELTARARAGGAGAVLTTLAGDQLTLGVSGGRLTLTDAAGRTAAVTAADSVQPNGVVHVVDRVLSVG